MSQKKKKPPAIIDYDNVAHENEPTYKWSHKDLKQYWRKQYIKWHRGTAPFWTLKEISLLSKMLKEYSAVDIAGMVELWMKSKDYKDASNFAYFYTDRVNVYHRLLEIKQIREGKWEW